MKLNSQNHVGAGIDLSGTPDLDGHLQRSFEQGETIMIKHDPPRFYIQKTWSQPPILD